VTNSWKTEFAYDGLLRRRVRKEYAWVNSNWAISNEVRYIYDGRLVLQERDGNNVTLVSYTRGSDLRGSRQGAGGIGGLLARTDHATVSPTHAFYHADGNGNITALLNDKQVVVARYEYDPFGNTLSKSGPLADANAYRFSSQEYHQPSGLVLYLYRAYDPNLQRFVNRDPIEEDGGINLYGFVANRPLSRVDPLGLGWFDPPMGDVQVLPNGDLYAPPLPLPDGIATPLSGGRANFFGDFKQDVHQFIDETGKELARNAACSAGGWGVGKALGAIGKKAGCVWGKCKGLFKKNPKLPVCASRGGVCDPRVVQQIKDDMLAGRYRFDSPEGRIGLYVDRKGNYMIGEGHHRVRAAIESGDPANLQRLIDNARITPVDSFPIPPAPIPPVGE
jgi:RHS repeat-associated protein